MNRLNATARLALLPALLSLGCADQSPLLAPDALAAAAAAANIVLVNPPTGNPAADRASILAALAAVAPGGTIQFAPGIYDIGLAEPFSGIEVSVPRVTLLGHPDITTLRGCAPAEIAPVLCEGLWLNGGRQSVRNLRFTDMSSALIVEASDATGGGYQIEGNTFRNTWEGVVAVGQAPQRTIVRNNTFTNVGAAVFFMGSSLRVEDNDMSAPEPELIPVDGDPFAAVFAFAWDLLATGPCDHNIIDRNRIDGYAVGIGLEVVAGESCSHNVIRDNVVTASRSHEIFELAPLFVWNVFGEAELTAHNLIQGNSVVRAEGAGLVIMQSSHTRVVSNTFEGVASNPHGVWLGAGNGSGVWVSAGSRDNRILANSFASVESYAVVLEGDHNHVATTSASHSVLDLGVDNRVTGPGSVASLAVAGSLFTPAALMAVARPEVTSAVGRPSIAAGRWEIARRRDREGARR